ncbi:MAG: TonB-dependent receptor [Melioribacteraceae bacterium]|nr:TonB-dependent receptor [Melioribacteraceae bacterium]
MSKLFFLFIFALTSFCHAQIMLHGIVKNKQSENIFAANVYLKSSPQKGTTTNFNGGFKLNIISFDDTLVVSFIGYETKNIPLSSINIDQKGINIILQKTSFVFDEVVITAPDPISEQFSVVKIKKMDIYFNPVAQGDPLKAITTLPASTTTNETASPSLRGSSADRTRVVFNGVPIYSPARASQLNNQGFFSLFNPEIINRQYVYASNPPLTYGNSTAGLVEIETNKILNKNQLQLSQTLASTGFFLSQKIKKSSFIQIYGNYQYSNVYVGIQKKHLPNINNFQTFDAGINLHFKVGKRTELNSFTYFIDESFNGLNESFTYKGDIDSEKKRFFTVNNFLFYSKNGLFSINTGINASKSGFEFGNINSENSVNQLYAAVNYKWFVLQNIDIQFGVSYDYQKNKFNNTAPLFYYAISPNSPSYKFYTTNSNNIVELYLYTKWDINNKLTFSSGIRSNIPISNQENYISSQFGLKYRVSRKQSLLFSGGKYYSYSVPNYFSQKQNLLKSYQIALDYSYEIKNMFIKAATYFKNEIGEQRTNTFYTFDNIKTFGVELFSEYNFFKYLKYTFSYSFINQSNEVFGKKYIGQKDFTYFIKTTLQYNNPKLFSIALTYIGRPGTFYTPIIDSKFDEKTGYFEPIFSNNLFSSQYGSYNRFDISLSKYIKLKNNAIITFVSLNNIFNIKNESNDLYNFDYSSEYFNYYQLRTIFFGIVWQFDY